jgi:hypothetical protein
LTMNPRGGLSGELSQRVSLRYGRRDRRERKGGEGEGGIQSCP